MKININKDNKVSEAQNRNFTTKQEKLPYLIFDVRPQQHKNNQKELGLKKKQLQVQDTFSALFRIQDHSSMEISQIQKGKKKKSAPTFGYLNFHGLSAKLVCAMCM